MKFFTPELHIRLQDFTSDEAMDAADAASAAAADSYHRHLEEIKHDMPECYRRADGTSLLRPADYHLYTTEALLDAEQRLLDAGRQTGSHGRTRSRRRLNAGIICFRCLRECGPVK